LAQRAVAQGVSVVWREFEAMPHCFAMLLENVNGAAVHYDEYARFCRDVVEGRKIETNGEVVMAKTLRRKSVDVGSGLTDIREDEVLGYMRKGKERIEKKFKAGSDPSADARPML
jgi:hypothetical protein